MVYQRNLSTFCMASDRHVDKSIVDRVRELKGVSSMEALPKLHKIINDCVYGALVSDFALRVLLISYRIIGGKDEDFHSPPSET